MSTMTPRRARLALFTLFLGLGAWSLPGAAPADPAGDRLAIARLLDAQVTAWNAGDLDGFMTGYWTSDRLTFFSGGSRTTGWRPTLDRYRKRYQGAGKEMGRLSFEDLDIELLGGRAALARGRWRLTTAAGNPGGLFTLVLKKLPDGWRIVHDHTSS